jgi:hypothetical protein
MKHHNLLVLASFKEERVDTNQLYLATLLSYQQANLLPAFKLLFIGG